MLVVGGYWYFWKNPVKVKTRERFERFRDNWRTDVHYQENVDWENKRVWFLYICIDNNNTQ